MNRHLFTLALLAATSAYAQEGVPTQAVISFDSKAAVTATANDITLKVENRPTPVLSIASVPAGGVQIAILIDDGLRTSLGRELDNLRFFVQGLPQGTEVFVGYMANGTVFPAAGANAGFTTNLGAAAAGFRIPSGIRGISASPYFCLTEFVKNWPGTAENTMPPQAPPAGQPAHKARIVLMITNGVDPYNGSTSILNQNSPYVDSAVNDAQRAGVPVYSIYFTDAGFGARRGSFSGQSYLAQIAQGTGGVAFYQGTGSPVSLAPYLKEFQDDVAKSYVISFAATESKNPVRLKVSTNLPKTKVRAPEEVRAGTVILQQ